jgi:hypothetical protein
LEQFGLYVLDGGPQVSTETALAREQGEASRNRPPKRGWHSAQPVAGV